MDEYTTQLLEHTLKLIVSDPFTSSYEGLDDYCIFCSSYYKYVHLKTCPWMNARKFLGIGFESSTQWNDLVTHSYEVSD